MNVHKQSYDIERSKQRVLKNHSSLLIWFTGLSGSGKSTIANELYKRLFALGLHVYALDGDNVRLGLNQDLQFTTADRLENIRRIGEVSKLFVNAGVITIAAFISPLNDHRRMIESIVGKEDYFEIFINTPIEECEKRDVKGLYSKARRGELKEFTGIEAPYEIPINPAIEINTMESSVDQAVGKILECILQKINL